jgi:hypothetical protein
METADKVMAGLALAFVFVLGFTVYCFHTQEVKELEFKYMAASAGAPLVVCVK